MVMVLVMVMVMVLVTRDCHGDSRWIVRWTVTVTILLFHSSGGMKTKLRGAVEEILPADRLFLADHAEGSGRSPGLPQKMLRGRLGTTLIPSMMGVRSEL